MGRHISIRRRDKLSISCLLLAAIAPQFVTAQASDGNPFIVAAPRQSAAAAVRSTPKAYTSPLGYAVDFNPQCTPWLNMADTDIEFGLLSGTTVAAAFHAAPLDGISVDAGTFTRAMMARYEVPWSALKDLEEIREGEAAGFSGKFEQSASSGVMHYQFRTLCTPKQALLAIAWSSDERKSALTKLIVESARIGPIPPMASDLAKVEQPVRRAWAGVLNSVGVHGSAAGQWGRALPLFQKASRLLPEEPVYADNTIVAMSELGMAGDALALGRKAMQQHSRSPDIRARVAGLLAADGKLKEAIELYKAAFDLGLKPERHAANYLQLLIRAGEHRAAIGAAEDWLPRVPLPAIAISLSDAYVADKQYDKAITLLQQWLDRTATNAEVGHALMATLDSAEKYQEILALADRLRDAGRENSVTWYWRGVAHLSLKAHREAKAAFEKSLELNPNDQTVANALKVASSLLGEGDRSELASGIDPVEVPPRLLAVDADASDRMNGYGAGYLNRVTAIRYVRGEKTLTSDYYDLIIKNQEGVKQFNELLIEFDPLKEAICINKVQVFDAANRLVAEGSKNDPYVLDKTGYMATYTRVLHVPIPGLAPGFRASVVVTRREHTSAENFEWQEQLMASYFPMARRAVVLRGDVSSVRQVSLGCSETAESDGSVVWEVQWPPVWKWEPLQDDANSYLPHVELGDKAASWTTLAQEYIDQIRDLTAPSKEAADLLLKIAPDPEAEARIRAILRYMQTHYTYKAIEFGRRARIPQPVPTIIANRYGDCKDHALLTMQLLRAAGLPAQLALVRTSGAITETLPSLDAFDHLIVYVGVGDKDLFYDTTSKAGDLTNGVPAGLEGRMALVLEDHHPRLIRIGDQQRISQMHVERDVVIDREGSAKVTETATFDGRMAAYYREYLRMSDPANRRASVRTLLQGAAIGLELHEATVEGIDTPDEKIVFHLRYTLRRHLTPGRDLLVGRVPAVWERLLLTQDYVDNRMSPFTMRYPMVIKGQTTVHLAEGLRIHDAPPAVSSSDRFSDAIVSTQANADGFGETHQVSVPPGRFGPGEYDAFRQSLEAALDLCARPFVVDAANR